jgi:hypothetical protein
MLMMMRLPEFLMMRRPEFLMMRRPELLMMRRPCVAPRRPKNKGRTASILLLLWCGVIVGRGVTVCRVRGCGNFPLKN